LDPALPHSIRLLGAGFVLSMNIFKGFFVACAVSYWPAWPCPFIGQGFPNFPGTWRRARGAYDGIDRHTARSTPHEALAWRSEVCVCECGAQARTCACGATRATSGGALTTNVHTGGEGRLFARASADSWAIGWPARLAAHLCVRETNRIWLVVFDMQNRILGPYPASINRILISAMMSWRAALQECAAVGGTDRADRPNPHVLLSR
jgi:hypothetical protein